MVTALKLGPFSNNLCKKSTLNLERLRKIVAKFIQLKEFKEFWNQVLVESLIKKKTNQT